MTRATWAEAGGNSLKALSRRETKVTLTSAIERRSHHAGRATVNSAVVCSSRTSWRRLPAKSVGDAEWVRRDDARRVKLHRADVARLVGGVAAIDEAYDGREASPVFPVRRERRQVGSHVKGDDTHRPVRGHHPGDTVREARLVVAGPAEHDDLALLDRRERREHAHAPDLDAEAEGVVHGPDIVEVVGAVPRGVRERREPQRFDLRIVHA